jgi:hypothetical protein
MQRRMLLPGDVHERFSLDRAFKQLDENLTWATSPLTMQRGVLLLIVEGTHWVDPQCPAAWQQCGNRGDGNQDSDPA